MSATTTSEELELQIEETIRIAAPIETAFRALIEELTVYNKAGSDDNPMPMVLEARPGGRWYRDLGEDNGHCWAIVQAIKRPALLEFCGPLFMSQPVTNNVQYRLEESDGGTELVLRHIAFGLIDPDHREGLKSGWGYMLRRTKKRAEAQGQ